MKAKITVNAKFKISEIDPKIYSGFIEHLGRAVYEGIYEPEHPEADADGFRRDVIELIKDLDMPLTRYPGGNFVSNYNWEDGVGPRGKRPKRLDLAWKAMEPNTFGTDEFVRWCRKANSAPMMAVNLGTRGPADAGNLVEYCNFPGGSHYSDMRRDNGSEQPYKIEYWCLGNEMDGSWQTGAKTATEYGRIAAEAGKIMKMIDPSIKLTLCGSSSQAMPTFGKWEEEVLKHAYDVTDYLSMHVYFSNAKQDMARFLASPDSVAEYIERTAVCCDAVMAAQKKTKKIMLSLDEWNVWYHSQGTDGRSAEWTVGRPLLEDVYDMADVLVNGGVLNTMINHSDRLKMACIAQSVNVIAPIMTEKGGKAWKQTIYYPQYYASRYGRGEALRQLVECDSYSVDCPMCAFRLEQVMYLSSATVWNEKTRELIVFAVNRNLEEPMSLEVETENFQPRSLVEALQIANPDLAAVNTRDQESVAPETLGTVKLCTGGFCAEFSPGSWNMIRIKC